MNNQNHSPIWALALLVLSTLNDQLSTPASAATLTVSNNNDDNGAGTLRQAIQTAGNGDSINFSVTGVITLTNGELLITKDLTITGPGATNLAIIGYYNRVFEIKQNVTARISSLAILRGHAISSPNNGGGIYNAGTVTLTACTIGGNISDNGGVGGGIYNVATLTLTGCTVSGNIATYRGGGIYNSGAGTLTLSGCTLNDNKSVYGEGGGIYNAGTLALSDCTVSRNVAGADVAGAGNQGGGIYNSGTLALTACTFSGNSAGQGLGGYCGRGCCHVGGLGGSGGAIFNAASAPSATLRSTVIALNSFGLGGPGCPNGSPGYGPDLFGSFTSQGHNLIGQTDGSGGFVNGVNGDLVGSTNAPLDPKLAALTNNGGGTFTMAVLPGSPALDAGDDALLVPPFNLMTDQRGLPRKSGAHVDIGAFELVVAGTPPHLGSAKRLANGVFQFGFGSTPGASFTVLAATDVSLSLSNWAVLGAPMEIAPGQFQFTDAQAATSERRFYLVRSP